MKTTADALQELIDAVKNSINVSKTCTVESVKGNYVNVKLEDGNILSDIPVKYFAKSEDVGFFMPVEKGDTGLLIFNDINLDSFLNNTISSSEIHSHDISDAIFIPGLFNNNKRQNPPDNIMIKNENMSIEISSDKIKIEGGTKEVLDLITKFMGDTISVLNSTINDTLVTPTGSGSHSVNLRTVVWPAKKSLLEGYQSDLESIKL